MILFTSCMHINVRWCNCLTSASSSSSSSSLVSSSATMSHLINGAALVWISFDTSLDTYFLDAYSHQPHTDVTCQQPPPWTRTSWTPTVTNHPLTSHVNNHLLGHILLGHLQSPTTHWRHMSTTTSLDTYFLDAYSHQPHTDVTCQQPPPWTRTSWKPTVTNHTLTSHVNNHLLGHVLLGRLQSPTTHWRHMSTITSLDTYFLDAYSPPTTHWRHMSTTTSLDTYFLDAYSHQPHTDVTCQQSPPWTRTSWTPTVTNHTLTSHVNNHLLGHVLLGRLQSPTTHWRHMSTITSLDTYFLDAYSHQPHTDVTCQQPPPWTRTSWIISHKHLTPSLHTSHINIVAASIHLIYH